MSQLEDYDEDARQEFKEEPMMTPMDADTHHSGAGVLEYQEAGGCVLEQSAAAASCQPFPSVLRPVRPRRPQAARPLAGSTALVRLAGPVTAAALTFALASPPSRSYAASGGVFVALVAARALIDRKPKWVQVLPLLRGLTLLVMLALSGVVITALHLAGAMPGVGGIAVALIASCAVIADATAARLGRPTSKLPVRIAVIGTERVAENLNREIRLAGMAERYDIVGRIIAPNETWSEAEEVPVIGRVGGLAEVVGLQELDLLLMGSTAPRMVVFEEVAQTCLQESVRMRELSSFYEEVFCHVASTEINAAWFQYILHPSYQAGPSRVERSLDLVVTVTVGIFVLPLLAVFAWLIRRDGGPAFFCQTRIGEGGRSFTMYKLRTMRDGNRDTSWATEKDARVTPIGSFLRRTHLDELPQLLNVLRGEMSIVGPRPEQPQLVLELEHDMPLYQRRHLVRPGVTGWAQVRCGYAGSHEGTAWKLSHDLYYLKHRSIWLNLAIMIETLRTLFADRQYTARPMSVDFILEPGYLGAADLQPSTS
ncbi:MAG: exopolysaccharide biosynthesis polyprenyl glycosylphosphotransferase [Solirubrobacteraceae bacterium]